MFYILRQTAVYRRTLLCLLFIIPILLPSFLVTSHAPELFEQAQTERHQLLASVEHQQTHQHSHADGFTDEQVTGHNHGHNNGDHQHGSIIVFDSEQLSINASFALNFSYLFFYYPPHIKLPEQPPKRLA